MNNSEKIKQSFPRAMQMLFSLCERVSKTTKLLNISGLFISLWLLGLLQIWRAGRQLAYGVCVCCVCVWVHNNSVGPL